MAAVLCGKPSCRRGDGGEACLLDGCYYSGYRGTEAVKVDVLLQSYVL